MEEETPDQAEELFLPDSDTSVWDSDTGSEVSRYGMGSEAGYLADEESLSEEEQQNFSFLSHRQEEDTPEEEPEEPEGPDEPPEEEEEEEEETPEPERKRRGIFCSCFPFSRIFRRKR